MPNLNASPLAAYRPGEVLIQFDVSAKGAAQSFALSAVGGRFAEEGEDIGAVSAFKRLALGEGVSVEKAIEILSKIPGVTLVEPDYVVSIDAVSNDTSVVAGQTWGLYGNVGAVTNAYGSQATEAWAAGFTGSTKVAVAVVDSGVDYTHPDLYKNIWLNQKEIPTALKAGLKDTDGDSLITFRDLNSALNASYVTDKNANGRIDAGDLLNDTRWENGVDEDANGYRDDLIGWDFVNNDNNPMDDNGHGTHVAGTIAATGGNGAGVAGIGWNTQVVALKFLDSTSYGYTSNSIKALDYFTNASKAGTGVDFAATNNSWGGAGYSGLQLDAITRGAKQGILYVAAAGNGSDSNDATPYYPAGYSTVATAGYEAVISVAAITSAGALASFSNYGAKSVDLGAPGSSIYSTLMGGGYGYKHGTSMATPHVAGAIALYSAAAPGATAAKIRADLLASTISTSSLVGKTVSGGRLDVATFVAKSGATGGDGGGGGGGGATITGTAYGDLITPTTTVAGQALPGTGADTLSGLGGADTLNGGAGIDVLIGGSGDDVFIFDNNVDTIVELAGGGIDLVKSGVTVTLAGNVEKVILTGTSAVSATGNELANVLTGNGAGNVLAGGAGNDELDGMAGADTLRGDDGADTLDGGAGIDRMEGGAGSDIYYVDVSGDQVIETLSGSVGGSGDKVISTASFTLGANVERLSLSGAAAIDGVGNGLSNVIYGNGAANRLTGMAGNDIIVGQAGNDTLVGGAGADTLTGGSGADRFIFSRGQTAGDVIQDFALGDIIQLTGYSAGSTLTKVAGSTTSWLVTDGSTHATELLKLANGYALKAGDFLFG